MDNRLNAVLGKNFTEGLPVANIFLIEFYFFTCYFFNAIKRFAAAVIKIINNDNIISGVEHFNAGMTADKTRSACYKNGHKRSTSKSIFASINNNAKEPFCQVFF